MFLNELEYAGKNNGTHICMYICVHTRQTALKQISWEKFLTFFDCMGTVLVEILTIRDEESEVNKVVARAISPPFPVVCVEGGGCLLYGSGR